MPARIGDSLCTAPGRSSKLSWVLAGSESPHAPGARMRRTTPLYPGARAMTSGDLHRALDAAQRPAAWPKTKRRAAFRLEAKSGPDPGVWLLAQKSESVLRKRVVGAGGREALGDPQGLALVLQEAGHLLLRQHGHAADEAGRAHGEQEAVRIGPLGARSRGRRGRSAPPPYGRQGPPRGPAPPWSDSARLGPPGRTGPACGRARARVAATAGDAARTRRGRHGGRATRPARGTPGSRGRRGRAPRPARRRGAADPPGNRRRRFRSGGIRRPSASFMRGRKTGESRATSEIGPPGTTSAPTRTRGSTARNRVP